MLKPDLAILDETDSGLDVDAVRLASEGIREYQKENPDGALLIITHSTRILDALHVDATHIMVNGMWHPGMHRWWIRSTAKVTRSMRSWHKKERMSGERRHT